MRIDQSEYRVSHTEVQTFKRCRRKWYLRYHLGWKQRDKVRRVARDTGIVVHAALHEYYANDYDEDRAVSYVADRRAEDLSIAQPHEVETLTEVYNLSSVILDGYFEWLGETGADAAFRITGSEQQLEAPGPIEGTTLFGIVDLIGEHTDGSIVVLDTKVVASIEETIRMLHLNEQALMYGILAKANEPNPARPFRIVWSMLKRSKRTARAVPPFYERYELTVSPGQLELYYEQLHGVLSQILELEQRLNDGAPANAVAYPSPTKDCPWECEFISVCPAMNDPHADPNWMLSTYFVNGSDPQGEESASADTVSVNITEKEQQS